MCCLLTLLFLWTLPQAGYAVISLAPIDFIHIIGDVEDIENDDDDEDDGYDVVLEYDATLRMSISMVIESTLNLRLR